MTGRSGCRVGARHDEEGDCQFYFRSRVEGRNDKAEYSDLFHELARSEYSEILICLDDKEHLSRPTLRMLIENDSLEVMRAILDSRRPRRHMTRRDLETYMRPMTTTF